MEYNNYLLVRGMMNLVEIKPIGSGSVHKDLRGFFTDMTTAMGVIDRFKPKKEPVSGNKKAKTKPIS